MKSAGLKTSQLIDFYKMARRHFGHQKWWPGETPLEVMIGAILTQNTAWTNVEKAIVNLKRENLLDLNALKKVPEEKLAQAIRPSGYFNVKTRRLKSFVEFIFQEYAGSLEKMFAEKGTKLREKLLRVSGIGPETADSILLYAALKPFFVIDAYTKRIFTRHHLQVSTSPASSSRMIRKMDYHEWQKIFMKSLPASRAVYNDFHAQIVHIGKHFCKTSMPLCSLCPLSCFL